MAALDLITQLFVDGVWTTYPSYAEDGWSAQIGPDVETGSRPSKITFTLANSDLNLDPTNIASSLYGKIGLNTPARLRINSATVTHAEASQWQPDTSIEHVPNGRGKAWVDVTAEGLLRRLARWTEPLASPMRRLIGSYASLTGYMPLENKAGAALLTQTVAGVRAGGYSGTVTLAGDDGAGGSDSCLTIGSDGAVWGYFATPTTSGWQFSFTNKLAAVPTTTTYQPMISWLDTTGRTWSWDVHSTNFRLTVTAADGTSLLSSAVGHSGALTTWTRFRVKVTVSAGTITAEPAWYVQDSNSIVGWSPTFAAASTGQPRSWSVAGNTWTTGAAYGHVAVVTDTALDLFSAREFDGWITELAAFRFARLLGEQGLTGLVSGDSSKTAPMGRQKPGVLLDLLTECVVTDGGLLYDDIGAIALTFRTRLDMTNRAPTLTLAKSDLPALRKTVDDVGVTNVVTVSNADGSEAIASLTSGRLSIQVPPAGVGSYKGGVDVNQANTGVLQQRANWEMRKGTLDRPRYLAVTVDLLGKPALKNTVTSMRPGFWIALTGVEFDTVYLRVISIERHGDAVTDTVTFSCLPAELWQVAVIDTSRMDSASTTLASGITSTATSVPITTVNPREVWSTTAVPYDIKVAGERMTVTACTAAAGTGPYTQTMTVTRSVNGAVKAQTAGTEVHLFDQRRIGL